MLSYLPISKRICKDREFENEEQYITHFHAAQCFGSLFILDTHIYFGWYCPYNPIEQALVASNLIIVSKRYGHNFWFALVW